MAKNGKKWLEMAGIWPEMTGIWPKYGAEYVAGLWITRRRQLEKRLTLRQLVSASGVGYRK